MSAIYILIGVSLTVAVGFLMAFLWAMKKGQYEDDYTPSVRILFENTPDSEKLITPIEDKKEIFCKTLINKHQNNL